MQDRTPTMSVLVGSIPRAGLPIELLARGSLPMPELADDRQLQPMAAIAELAQRASFPPRDIESLIGIAIGAGRIGYRMGDGALCFGLPSNAGRQARAVRQGGAFDVLADGDGWAGLEEATARHPRFIPAIVTVESLLRDPDVRIFVAQAISFLKVEVGLIVSERALSEPEKNGALDVAKPGRKKNPFYERAVDFARDRLCDDGGSLADGSADRREVEAVIWDWLDRHGQEHPAKSTMQNMVAQAIRRWEDSRGG